MRAAKVVTATIMTRPKTARRKAQPHEGAIASGRAIKASAFDIVINIPGSFEGCLTKATQGERIDQRSLPAIRCAFG